jgi:hypothetical protein
MDFIWRNVQLAEYAVSRTFCKMTPTQSEIFFLLSCTGHQRRFVISIRRYVPSIYSPKLRTQSWNLEESKSSHTTKNNKPTSLIFIIAYINIYKQQTKQTPWSESASELYRPSDRRLSAKLVPTFADRARHVVSVTDPQGCILGFLDRSRNFLFQVAPQLYSKAPFQTHCFSENPVALAIEPGPLICSHELWPLDHRGGLLIFT